MKIIKVDNIVFNFDSLKNKYGIYVIYDEIMIVRTSDILGVNYFFIKDNELFLHIIDTEKNSDFYVNKIIKEIFIINKVEKSFFSGISVRFNPCGCDYDYSSVNKYKFIARYKDCKVALVKK